MARPAERHPANVDGDWYVDTRCIDCDASRQMAPTLIGCAGGQSVFIRQPETAEEHAAAWRAMLVCPTLSIGNLRQRRPPSPPFPFDEGDGVFRCGHNTRDSFGAHSYLIVREQGNLLIDGPRFTRELVEPIAARGGLSDVLLTHRDDIGDAARYAAQFGARVWIHHDDRSAAPFATDFITGIEFTPLREDLLALPVPGHTRGSTMYLLDGHILFTGDSLAWSPQHEWLIAFEDASWYSWPEQKRSLGRVADSPIRFDALFAGHGWSHRDNREQLNQQLQALVARM